MIDALIVLALAAAALAGWRSGFVITMYGLIGLAAALLVAVTLGPQAAERLRATLPMPAGALEAAAFGALLLLVGVVFAVIGRVGVHPAVGRARRSPAVAALDSVLGVVPAAVRVLLVVAVAVASLPLLGAGDGVRDAVGDSRIVRVLTPQVALVRPALIQLAGTAADTPWPPATRLGADESRVLELPEGLVLEVDPGAERQLTALVNDERVLAGLRPLEARAGLAVVARSHSEEMFRLRFFAHASAATGSPFDRITAAGIAFTRAGENLAYAPSVAAAHRGLMESPGHRENILRPEFTHVGIGAVSAGRYGRMFTQLFIAE